MSTAGATLPQLDYVESLARQARVPVDLDKIVTVSDASAAIEDLQKQVELTPRTRAAIFAALKQTGKTKSDLYAAIGVESLAANSTASEWHGKRALRWIKGESIERRVVTDKTFIQQLAEEDRMDKKPPQRGPRRPMVNPYREQPAGPQVTVREPPPVEQRPVNVPGVRRPLRPGRIATAPQQPEDGIEVPFVVPTTRVVRLVTDAEADLVEQITRGVTRATAHTVLKKLAELMFDVGPLAADGWHLTTEQKNVLGLMEPAAMFFGSVRSRVGNSNWWSRNRQHKDGRCAPPF